MCHGFLLIKKKKIDTLFILQNTSLCQSHPLPVPSSSPPYLGAAVWSGGAPVEVVLGQKEGRVGHVQKGVVHQHYLAEVKLVCETLPFGFVQNALIVVIPAEEKERISKEGSSGGIKEKGRGKGKEEGRINITLASRFRVSSLTEANK